MKHIGIEVANKLVQERTKGVFTTFFDFVKRSHEFLGEKVMQALIDAGACGAFGYTPATLHANVGRILDFVKYDGGLLGGVFEMTVVAEPEPDPVLLMERELELFGFYLHTHPIRLFEGAIAQNGWLVPTAVSTLQRGNVQCAGFVHRVREIRDKNGNLMAFVELTDEAMQLDVTIFSREYDASYKLLVNQVIVVEGALQFRNDRLGLNFSRLVATLTQN